MSNAVTYESDLYAWAMEQAALLRSGRLSEADIANIAEEIESLGRSEKRELVDRLAVLLLHMLKWALQPTHRSKSSQHIMVEQRRRLRRHLEEDPSLHGALRADIDVAFDYGFLPD